MAKLIEETSDFDMALEDVRQAIEKHGLDIRETFALLGIIQVEAIGGALDALKERQELQERLKRSP
jgi:hypothetical protein